MLCLGIDPLVLGHRQRQREGHGAAQPAPTDCQLVGAADFLAEVQRAEQRQDTEQDRGARHQGRRDHDQQQPQMPQFDFAQQLRDERGSGNENQRTRPEAGLLPHPFEISPVAGSDADPANRTRRQARADDRDDAGYVELLAHQIDNVGQRDRQRDLGHPRAAEKRQDGAEHATRDCAKDQAADECLGKANDPAGEARMGMGLAGQDLDQNRKQDDRRGIVQQALAFEEPVQPWRRPDLAKDRDHRRRIGGRDNGSDQQRHRQRDPGQG
jgi:hypothetical protein